MITCNNCGVEYEGNFCPNCGQKPNSGRIVFRESARDVLEHYFDFDAPLFRTIKGLLTKPGKVIREYIRGKRRAYAHPFRFFILSLALYLIVQQLIGFDPVETFSKILGVQEMPNPDSVASKGSSFFSSHINSFLLIYVLTLSIFSRVFYIKSGFYYVEYLALSFFVIAEYILINTFVILATFLSPYIFLLNYLLVLIYPVYVLMKFHEEKGVWTGIKAFFVSVLAWVLYAFLGHFIAIFIVIAFDL